MTSKRSRGPLLAALAVLTSLCVCAIAVATLWVVGPAPRCALPEQGQAEAGWSARTLVSGGLERCYYLYVPPDYDPAQPAPLVMSLHGYVLNASSHAALSGWHKLAGQEGFLVAYPQGSKLPRRWNSGAIWGNSDVDDVQFLLDLLDDLSALAAVDPSRVYVNGYSNGGGMSLRAGCELAGKIAAVGSVAGAVVDTEDCNPSRPMPVMAFHGTADPIVPYEGGNMQAGLLAWSAGLVSAPTYFVGAEDWVAAWAEGNACEPTPEAIAPQGDVRGVRYTGCDQGAEVILYTIEDGGHTWPGGLPIPGLGKTSRDIDATEELWRFFQQYRLED